MKGFEIQLVQQGNSLVLAQMDGERGPNAFIDVTHGPEARHSQWIERFETNDNRFRKVLMSERKVSRTVVVRTPRGLHLRPWGKFAELAHQFDAQVVVYKGGTQADGRSTMQLLTLAAVEGAELQVEAQGPAAEEAVAALCEFIDQLFEEIDTTEENLSG